MGISEAMRKRHSVRQYTDQKIEPEKRKILISEANAINRESGLHIQIFFDEPKCFDSAMAHYGSFLGVTDYIALVGKKSPDLEEKCGYFGERLVLLAQTIGLCSCWVALTHGKSAAKVSSGEKEVCLIAIGYGQTQGTPHQNKDLSAVTEVNGTAPDWFWTGMDAVMLAPTAMNQQKFLFIYDGNNVHAKVSGMGFYTKMDLGIVKYHFETATGRKVLP